NVVLLLNDLEDRGYVSRRRDPSDRRRHLVELTPPGRRALARAERAQEGIEDDVLRALDAEERATLWRLLTRAPYGAPPPPRRPTLQRDDRVDLPVGPPRQLRHAEGHPSRRLVGEEARVDLVDLREGREVGQVYGHAHGPLQRSPRRLAHRPQVLQAAAALLGR